jgi:hypothetical protein
MKTVGKFSSPYRMRPGKLNPDFIKLLTKRLRNFQRVNLLGASQISYKRGQADIGSIRGSAMKQAWDVFDYEIRQLNGTWKELIRGEERVHVRNSLIESAMKSFRVIMDMLRTIPKFKSPVDGDFCLTELIGPGYVPSPEYAELMKAYEDDAYYKTLLASLPGTFGAYASEAPKNQIDKLMVHPTRLRTTTHDWQPLLRIMLPLLWPVIDEIYRHPGQTYGASIQPGLSRIMPGVNFCCASSPPPDGSGGIIEIRPGLDGQVRMPMKPKGP